MFVILENRKKILTEKPTTYDCFYIFMFPADKMQPGIQHNILRGQKCKFCQKRFHAQNMTFYLCHLNRHQKCIKPYWYKNPHLSPKSGCVKFKRKSRGKQTGSRKMQRRCKSSGEMNQYQKENIQEVVIKKEIVDDSEWIAQAPKDAKEQDESGHEPHFGDSHGELIQGKKIQEIVIKKEILDNSERITQDRNVAIREKKRPRHKSHTRYSKIESIPKLALKKDNSEGENYAKEQDKCDKEPQTKDWQSEHNISDVIKIERFDLNDDLHNQSNGDQDTITKKQAVPKTWTRTSLKESHTKQIGQDKNKMESVNLNENQSYPIRDTTPEMMQQKFATYKQGIRTSRRLRNRRKDVKKENIDMNGSDLSDAELEMIDEANFEKAVQNSLSDNLVPSVCDICVMPVACSNDLISHEGIWVCMGCFKMLSSISENEDKNLQVKVETETSDLEIIGITSPVKSVNNVKAGDDGGRESVKMQHENNMKKDGQNMMRKNVIKKITISVKEAAELAHSVSGSDKAKALSKKTGTIFRKGDFDPKKRFKCPHCPKRFDHETGINRHIKSIHEVKHPHKCSYCDKTFYRTDQKRYHEMQHTGEKPFKCKLCDKAFKIKSSLTAHLKIHTNDRPHKCTYCDKCFTTKRDVDRHEVIHTGETPFNCQYCAKSFRYESSRDIHEMVHKGDKPYKCKFCAKRFCKKSFRTKHEMVHTDERPLQCDFCEKRFRNNACKKDHERSHTGETPFQCKFCDKRFRHRNQREIHQRFHTGEKPFQCSFCDKTFRQRSEALSHEKVHTGEKPYKCSYCPKMFSQHSARKTHERCHTGEKPFQCRFCTATFTTSSSVKLHERTHTGEKPHKCSFCDKTFSRKAHRVNHERTHTGEKPFKCSHCPKTFSKKVSRDEHLRIHTGERPHACSQCDKSFIRSTDLKKHLRTHTGEKPYRCRVCLKAFADSSTMGKHVKIVHEHQKPHKCSYCSDTFSTAGGKKVHEMIHTGEKPYNCSYCERTFRHPNSLKWHENLHIKEETDESD